MIKFGGDQVSCCFQCWVYTLLLSLISFFGLGLMEVGCVCWKKLLFFCYFSMRLTWDWFLPRLRIDCAGLADCSLDRPFDFLPSFAAIFLLNLSVRWNLSRQSTRFWLISSDLVSMYSFLKRLRILNFWSLVLSAAMKLTVFSFSSRLSEVGALSLLFLYLMSSRLNSFTSCSVCSSSCSMLFLACFSGKCLRNRTSSFSFCICLMS